MHYIITSGPMESQIDNVRKIKNSSSGLLGKTCATYLAQKHKVTYIHTPGVLVPDNHKILKIEIQNTSDLILALKEHITDDNTCVIHAMAIADFYVAGSVNVNKIIENIYDNLDSISTKEDINQIINNSFTKVTKLPSSHNQLLYLKKDIKVIDQIKAINSNIRLIGFKLLSNTDVDTLISVGNNLKNRSDADLIIANLKEEVSNSKHIAYMIGNNNKKLTSKLDIAIAIEEFIDNKN